MRRVLVLGGTGMVGAPVARRLAADGAEVRVLTRRPEAARTDPSPGLEVVGGDARRADDVRRAAEGCDAIHVSLRGGDIERNREVEVLGVRHAVAAAHAVGAARVSYVSGAGDLEHHADAPLIDHKLAAEAELRAHPGHVVLRPTHFMESLPMFVRGQRAAIPGPQPHRFSYLAAEDFARVVSAALRDERARGVTLTVLGPEALTMREALETYVSICAPGVRVGSVPLPLIRLMATVTRCAEIRTVAALFRTFQLVPEDGSPSDLDARALHGGALERLEEWCRRRRAEEGRPRDRRPRPLRARRRS